MRFVAYRARRGLDKALFQSLLTGKWITDKRGLIITGPCGRKDLARLRPGAGGLS